MANSSSSSSGIGFLGVLTVVFVIAKLWGVVDWSWWWVFAPIWVVCVGFWILWAVLPERKSKKVYRGGGIL